MRIARVVAVLAAAAALLLSACGKTAKDNGPAVSQSAATNVAVPGSATFDAMKARGKAIIGVKQDQPGLGYMDPTTGKYSGFDIEIARMVAASLGFAEDKIEYVAVPSANRETAISTGQVDFYVGTYSITDTRKQQVSFAGPYYIAGQDLLVRKSDTSITGPDSLAGKKICSVTGSTPAARLKDRGYDVLELEVYSLCVDQLLNNQVDTVSTDDAILKGYAADSPDKLKVVGQPFSTEKYGIGLSLTDAALRGKINDVLAGAFADGQWQQIYDATLGKSGSAASPPTLERY
ncbi:MAG: glutamate ABC transporter substrate-binding protein [Frankiaceae bacterium]|jgi:glutamate transport system substrate-binding protein|nr:glutamate ABC transporter substrate-binding protein [Frankiaceae bacterium]